MNDGSQYRLSGLNVIDETKLRQLDAQTVQQLLKNGLLGLIYAHIMSLGNLGRLADRIGSRGPAGLSKTQH